MVGDFEMAKPKKRKKPKKPVDKKFTEKIDLTKTDIGKTMLLEPPLLEDTQLKKGMRCRAVWGYEFRDEFPDEEYDLAGVVVRVIGNGPLEDQVCVLRLAGSGEVEFFPDFRRPEAKEDAPEDEIQAGAFLDPDEWRLTITTMKRRRKKKKTKKHEAHHHHNHNLNDSGSQCLLLVAGKA